GPGSALTAVAGARSAGMRRSSLRQEGLVIELTDQVVDLAHDLVLRVQGVGPGMDGAVGVGLIALVAAADQDLAAGEIAENVVGIAGEPDGGGSAAELALEAERVFHRRLAPDRDHEQVGPEPDHLHGAGVAL